MLELLRGTAGPAESAAGTVLPAAVHWVLRRRVVGAGNRVAGGGFAESAVVSGPGPDGGCAGPLDAVADAAADCRRDARSGVHVGAGAGGGGGPGSRKDDRHRCDDVGGERGDAQHRASGHGRIARSVSGAVGGGVWDSDADASGIGAVRPVAEGQDDVEQGLAVPAGTRTRRLGR